MNSDFSNKLKQALDSAVPFVLFRKPGENTVNLYVNDHSGENVYLMHSFDNGSEIPVSDKDSAQMAQDDFNFEFDLRLRRAPAFNPVDEENYIRLIGKTVDKIKTSEIRKIVVSRIKEIVNQDFNSFISFKNLMQAHPGALVYLWHNPGQETWLGATPELLLSKNNDQVNTVSLAGTKLPENEWTSKEFEEQQIVTDYIAANFSGLSEVKINGPETVQAGKFQHLKTYISAKSNTGFSIAQLLEKLHPTPAVCGLPKENAFNFILENEGYDRGFYSGYMGIETGNSQQYFVNLRCAQIYEDKIWIYVGGGITADSNPQKEWKETELKSGTILNALS